MRQPTPTDVAAGGFLVAAVGFGVWHASTPYFSAWTPNLGASCLEIAATIAIVDRIVRRAQRQAIQPRLEAARELIDSALDRLVEVVRIDHLLMARTDQELELAPDAETLDWWLRCSADGRPTGRRAGDDFGEPFR